MKQNLIIRLMILIIAIIFVSACSTTSKLNKNLSKTADLVNDKQQVVSEDKFHDQLDEAENNLKKHVDEVLKRNNKDEITFYASDLFLKANDSSLRGDAQIASLLYKYILVLKPDLYVKKKYAIELIRIGDLDESLELLHEVYKKGYKKDENIGLVIGGVYTALGKKIKARKIYSRILAKNPKNAEACIYLAKSYVLDSKFKKVKRLLSRCEKKIRGNASFAYYGGKIALARNRRKEAIKNFKYALKIDYKYYQAAIALGVMYEEKEKYISARRIYAKFLRRNPDNYEVLTRIVQILFLKEKPKKIIPYAERLSNLDPTDLNVKVKLGVLYTDVKKYQKAKGVFKEILIAVPDSDKVLYYLGSLCQELGEYEEAITYYNEISAQSELFRSGNIEIAKMLYVMAIPEFKGEKKKEEGERLVSFVEKKSKNHPVLKVDLYFNLATYYESQLNYTEAIELMSNVKGEQQYTHDHDYYLASLFEKNGDIDNSRNIIQNIINKDPNNAHALNFLGYSYLENNDDWDKAYMYISKAINIKPDDGYIRDSLGWYYFKTGKFKRAIKELKQAWKNEKTDPVINQHLAIVYQKMKHYDKAKKYFMEALKNCKEDSETRSQIVQALEGLERVRLPASLK